MENIMLVWASFLAVNQGLHISPMYPGLYLLLNLVHISEMRSRGLSRSGALVYYGKEYEHTRVYVGGGEQGELGAENLHDQSFQRCQRADCSFIFRFKFFFKEKYFITITIGFYLVSFLAYLNLFGNKGLVVVVVVLLI